MRWEPFVAAAVPRHPERTKGYGVVYSAIFVTQIMK